VTSYGLDEGEGVLFTPVGRNFSLLHSVHTGYGALEVFYPVKDCFPAEWATKVCETDQLRLSNAEFKNGGAVFPCSLLFLGKVLN
jgi:hypothetical protein